MVLIIVSRNFHTFGEKWVDQDLDRDLVLELDRQTLIQLLKTNLRFTFLFASLEEQLTYKNVKFQMKRFIIKEGE